MNYENITKEDLYTLVDNLNVSDRYNVYIECITSQSEESEDLLEMFKIFKLI